MAIAPKPPNYSASRVRRSIVDGAVRDYARVAANSLPRKQDGACPGVWLRWKSDIYCRYIHGN
jgi:hypothetical protein